MNEAELPAMAHRYQPARTHHVPDTAAVPAPRPKFAGAQERSRCSPLRRNDLDRSEHRHTINTAGTAAADARRKTKMSTDKALPHRRIRCQLPTAGRLAAPFDRPRISRAPDSHHVKDAD